jgi:signal transduction histidine kinase
MWRLHIVLAVGLFLLIQLEMWVISLDALPPQRRPVALLISLFAAAPLAVMSRPSLWPFAVNALATMGFVSLGYQSEVYQWGNLILLGMVGMLLPGWRSWVGLAGGLAGVSYYFLTFEDESRGTWLMVAAIWIMAWLIGRVYGSQQAQARLRAERDLADEIAATRQERLELESQRSRMARELHDLIGHTVNVMVVHAGGGRRAVRTDPDGAEAAFATIESTGRAALDELDRVLGILRDKDSDAPVAPLPGLESIAGLVQEFEQAGLPTTLALNGPVDAVPGGVGGTPRCEIA